MISEGENPCSRSSSARSPETEPQAVGHRHNFHVFWILTVTTFRTIDLEGEKISSPLFSRFCEEESVFFEEPPRS